MEKFSRITTKKADTNAQSGVTYKGFEIINHNDWDFIKEKDMVAILPYFVDDGHIYLRSENIPTYQHGFKDDRQFKSMQNFITVIIGTVEAGENVGNAIRRELYEDAGVVLSSAFPIEISTPLFLGKKNGSKCYLCLLEIRYNDYKQTTPKNVQKDIESQSRTIKVDLGYIDDIKTFDLITELMLTKLKMIMPYKK